MMEAMAQRPAAVAGRRADRQRQAIAAALAELLPEDIQVTIEGEAIALSGRAIGSRLLHDPELAVLRDGAGRIA